MADTNTQTAARAAAVDPIQRAAAEHRRLRACTPEVVALLAYCGSEEARERQPCHKMACPLRECGDTHHMWTWDHVDHVSPEEWARGLAPLLQAALDDPAVARVLAAVTRAGDSAAHADRLRLRSAQIWAKKGEWVTGVLAHMASLLGPRIRDVARDAVRREVFG